MAIRKVCVRFVELCRQMGLLATASVVKCRRHRIEFGESMHYGLAAAALTFVVATSYPSLAGDSKALFDGKTLKGWEGDTKETWRIERGTIAGGSLSRPVPRNEFLCTTQIYKDFRLKVMFKLVGDRKAANAGIQFRTKRIPNHHEVIGYQADIGQHYWGALYDESRRDRILAGPPAEDIKKLVRHAQWNSYVITCEGPRVRLWLNGTLTVDYTEQDPNIERAGVICLQIHGGAKAKVYYSGIRIEE
jgi:hypothetical protein